MPRDLNQMTWLHLHPNKWDVELLRAFMHQSTMCEPTPPLSETQLDMQALGMAYVMFGKKMDIRAVTY